VSLKATLSSQCTHFKKYWLDPKVYYRVYTGCIYLIQKEMLRMKTVFNVEKMMCGGCEANVKKALADVTSVDSVEVDLEAKTVTVEGSVDAAAIATIISDAGYPATQA
jgi:copper chaperone CopZ